MNPYALEIFTDGSSKVKMGFNAGCGAIIRYPEHVNLDPKEIKWSYDKSKIGAMEIGGINNSLQWMIDNIVELKKLNINVAIIHCDNQTVVSCANTYVYSWANNGWKKLDGGSIANLESWKKYMSLKRKISGISVEMEWIKGKSTDETKKVDKLAKNAADKIPEFINRDYMPQKVADTITKHEFVLEKFESNSREDLLIRVYFHQRINQKKNSDVKIYFELIENNEIVGRFYAFSSSEFSAKYIDRKNYYYSKIDTSLKNRPIFVSVDKIIGKELDDLKDALKIKYGRC
jgi:ribonuclease HI